MWPGHYVSFFPGLVVGILVVGEMQERSVKASSIPGPPHWPRKLTQPHLPLEAAEWPAKAPFVSMRALFAHLWRIGACLKEAV